MIQLKTAYFSHIGGRDEQQDAAHIWSNDEAVLVVVADGVGGNVGGAAASQAAIRASENYWTQKAGIFESPEQDLTSIAKEAHEAVCQLAPRERRSPSSTLVALYIDKKSQQAHWVHCGDSRLYHFRNGELIERTRDHSIVQLLLEQGEITEEELSKHPDKGRILKSLGASSFKGVDYGSCQIQEGDRFMLCSDGYWESLEHGDPPLPPQMEDQTLDESIQEMVHGAVQRNGDDGDNTTVAVVSVISAPISEKSDSETIEPAESSRSEFWVILPAILIVIAIVEVIFLIWIYMNNA